MSTITTTILSGPATVLSAGEVTAFGGASLRWILAVDGEPVQLEIDFASDPAIQDVAVQSEQLEHGYRLTCVNFDRPDGRGSSVPVLLKVVGGDAVFVHFRVFLFGRTADRTVHYTFYRAPQAFFESLSEESGG